jgi:hypothetical protein
VLTLGITVTLALLVSRRLTWAGLVLGLTASAKYPGALLVVPLLVAGWGQWRAVGRACVLALVGFSLTSPFVLIHASRAWDDVRRVQRLAHEGWLGFEDDPATPIAFAERLWEALGPVALAGLLATVVLPLVRRRRADVVLASFALAYWLWLMPLDAHFDRYVLPLVPVIGVLVGSVRVVAPLALALLVVPLAWSLDEARELQGEDTRLRVDAWVSDNVPPEDRIAADPSTLPLRDRDPLRLGLPGPGREEDPRRDVVELERLGVRWVIVTGAVADRVGRHPALYPRTAAFYDALAREHPPVFESTTDDPGLSGPWVRVYRLAGDREP